MTNTSLPPLPPFPNYTQLRAHSRIPLALWSALRVVSVAATLLLIGLLLVEPQTGLIVFWSILVPLLPAVFFIAPGLWRNICPLAALNQTPRVFGFTRGWTAPKWWQEYSYVVGFVLFLACASSRKWLFNDDGLASGLLIAGALVGAFLGGVLFKGKSGWCSSLCPLYPVQRVYNQTPLLTLPNSHCTPCVGCTKNCYDFNPGVAYLADLYDDDPYYSNYRRFFVAVFPGFVLAYFTLPDPPALTLASLYWGFGMYMLLSVGVFFLLDIFLKVTTNKITALFTAVAFNTYYWFSIPAWLHTISGAESQAWSWGLRGAVLVATGVWLARTYAKEQPFLQHIMQPEETRVTVGAARVLREATKTGSAEVTFLPQELRVLVEPNRTVLETAEGNNLPLEAGCRMGVCGADPIVILNGMENLSPISDDERSTLERLGLGANARMACMCRVKGAVSISLHIQDAQPAAPIASANARYDETIKQVVIIGNGIGGVTAADYVRRNHPLCEIHLIGREKHPLYNRMAITRLIYGRSAMSGLYLQPDSWYDERKITVWLNTRAAHIRPAEKFVELATGEHLPYDRLIIAAGSESYMPPITGDGLPGIFVVREAEDAMEMRAYVQEHRCRRAVIAGGGLLGLEAGYALHKLGLDVSILERSSWLLRRQLDERGSQFLRHYLEGLGMDIVTHAELEGVTGEQRAQTVQLKDGRTFDCDVLVVAAGIQPNIHLAHELGLEIDRGIMVDEHMRTQLPEVFAVGDAAQFNGKVLGLWPVAVEQAKVAAINAAGGDAVYREIVPVTALKVVGVELTSIGRFEPETDEEMVITVEDTAAHQYRKLLIAQGKIVGAIFLGCPTDVPVVTEVIKREVDVTPHLDALRAGEWQVLASAV